MARATSGKFDATISDDDRQIEYAVVVEWELDHGWDSGYRPVEYVSAATVKSCSAMFSTIPAKYVCGIKTADETDLWLDVPGAEKISEEWFLETYQEQLDAALWDHLGDEYAEAEKRWERSERL